MKIAAAMFCIVMAASHSASSACSIQNAEIGQVGSREAVTGECSNNKLPISCFPLDDDRMSCEGPSGVHSGPVLNRLIFLACGCTEQGQKDENQKKEMKQLGDKFLI